MAAAIEQILPHREPFLLIDEVVEVTPGVGAVARKTVREDEWVGRVLRVGGMTMRVDQRDDRCVIVTVDPVTHARDPAVLKTIARERSNCVGVYGSIVTPGHVSVDDAVTIES